MFSHLAPARRRFFQALIGIAALIVVVALVTTVLRRHHDAVTPVVQDRLGPVLLVPGYGGSTSSLDVLAAALDTEGRDTEVVPAVGDGTGDLRDDAAALDQAVRAALDRTGAPSVDVVGYSAGGVVVRYWVKELGGDALARRVVTLSAPHHGTDLAALAGSIAPGACPVACQQLAPDSDLLRQLNQGDETPAGPLWIALWTVDDKTVVPPTSGSLEGALDFSVQSVCPDLQVSHGDMPRTPAVISMVEAELGRAAPARPPGSVC